MNRDDIVQITEGLLTGKKATVLATAGDRIAVVVHGKADSSAFRSYVPSSLRLVEPATPPALKPEATPAASPFRCNNLVLDEDWRNGIDPSRWRLYNGPGHAGNGLRDPLCWGVKQIDGAPCLVGIAYWDAALGKIRQPGMRSVLQGLTTFRVTARCRMDPDPSDVTQANPIMTWADDEQSGEFNIFESSGEGNPQRKPMHCYNHYVLAGGQPQDAFDHGVDGTLWHDVTHERTPGYARVWVDGKLTVDITDPAHVIRAPHHLTIQLDAIRNSDPGGVVGMYVGRVQVFT